MMDQDAITQYLTETFDDVQASTALGYIFFFYSDERMMPFVTIATQDNEHDRVSNLSRPGVFRLNIGVGKQIYRSLFGEKPPSGEATPNTSYDYAALDQIMPHPEYAAQYWVCVLNPGDETFLKVQTLLSAAYDQAVRRRAGK